MDVAFALGLSLLAGGSTAIGSALVLFDKASSDRVLAGGLGFSAGVMIFVSFVELLGDAAETLGAVLGAREGQALAFAAFFGGVLLIALIDRLVPEPGNPHEMKNTHVRHPEGCTHRTGTWAEVTAERERPKLPTEGGEGHKRQRMMRVGMLSALAIAIHNFPEGLATFASALHDEDLGVAIAVAVGIHNIPEGIAVSIPMLHATGSRRKAFLLSAASGLAEPLGAVLGWLVLAQLFGPFTTGVMLAAVAGIMVFISIDQLLPAAEEFGEHHIATYGLVSGMVVMAGSLLLL